MRPLDIVDLGRMRYADALEVQEKAVELRKQGLGRDTLFFVEHPHVVTMGRNAKTQNVLASEEVLARTGIEFFETNRGGDVTYHGPGQVVGYPVLDLREWKRDVHAFFQGVEQALDGCAAGVWSACRAHCQARIRGCLGEGCQDCGNWHSHQPVDYLARVCAEHGNRSELFQIHCAVRIDEAGVLASESGRWWLDVKK